MSKPVVVSGEDRTRIPFLRGILTRSLQEFGLSFEDSYKIATEVREQISSKTEIIDSDLREMVALRLKELDPDLSQRYLMPQTASSPVLVELGGGQNVPFSRGQHRTEFESCGLDPEQAREVAERLYYDLLVRAGVPVTLNRVGSMMTAFFNAGEVTDYAGASASDTERFGRYFREMLGSGIYIAPSQFEALFVSTAHGETEVDETVAAARKALQAIAGAG